MGERGVGALSWWLVAESANECSTGPFSSSAANPEAARAARGEGTELFPAPFAVSPSHPAMPRWLGAPQPRVLVLGAGAVCFGRR